MMPQLDVVRASLSHAKLARRSTLTDLEERRVYPSESVRLVKGSALSPMPAIVSRWAEDLNDHLEGFR
jgi:hypothetical protein